jgi:hypothetical protein
MARSHFGGHSHLRPRAPLNPQELLPLTPEVEAVYAAAEASLTEEERADMEALHAGLADGSLVSSLTPEEEMRVLAMAGAPPRVRKATRRMTVRMTQEDVETLQQKAQEQGMPYQTLLKSVIRQYLAGKLVPRP